MYEATKFVMILWILAVVPGMLFLVSTIGEYREHDADNWYVSLENDILPVFGQYLIGLGCLLFFGYASDVDEKKKKG